MKTKALAFIKTRVLAFVFFFCFVLFCLGGSNSKYFVTISVLQRKIRAQFLVLKLTNRLRTNLKLVFKGREKK